MLIITIIHESIISQYLASYAQTLTFKNFITETFRQYIHIFNQETETKWSNCESASNLIFFNSKSVVRNWDIFEYNSFRELAYRASTIQGHKDSYEEGGEVWSTNIYHEKFDKREIYAFPNMKAFRTCMTCLIDSITCIIVVQLCTVIGLRIKKPVKFS